MKWKIRLSLFTAVAIMSVVIPCATAFADSPEITHARVFSGYKEDGDWLVVVAYNCSEAPYYPYYPPEEHWTIQLLNAAGTVVAQDPMWQWGKRPEGIYISATDATALEWGNPAYKVRIIANYNSSINDDYTLTADYWYDEALSQLDSWVLTYAKEMEDYDSPTDPYIEDTVQHGPMLSIQAGAIFDIGISELSEVRPNLFIAKIEEFAEWEDTTWTNSYSTSLDDWETAVGTELAEYFQDAGDLVDMDGRYVGGLLVFIGFIALAALAVTTGHLTAGCTLAIPALCGGAVIGLIPIQAIFVGIVLLTIMFIKNYWFGGT